MRTHDGIHRRRRKIAKNVLDNAKGGRRQIAKIIEMDQCGEGRDPIRDVYIREKDQKKKTSKSIRESSAHYGSHQTDSSICVDPTYYKNTEERFKFIKTTRYMKSTDKKLM